MTTNPYYQATGNPATRAVGLSQLVRAEFLALQAGFDAVPAIDGGGKFPWSSLPASARQLPIRFSIVGKPGSGQVYNQLLGMSYTIPANFSGVAYFSTTTSLIDQTFIVNRVSTGFGTVITQLGTLTVHAGNNATITPSVQALISMQAGHTLQLVAPNPQDANLADLCLTIMAQLT